MRSLIMDIKFVDRFHLLPDKTVISYVPKRSPGSTITSEWMFECLPFCRHDAVIATCFTEISMLSLIGSDSGCKWVVTSYNSVLSTTRHGTLGCVALRQWMRTFNKLLDTPPLYIQSESKSDGFCCTY